VAPIPRLNPVLRHFAGRQDAGFDRTALRHPDCYYPGDMEPSVIVFEAGANGEPPLAGVLASGGCEVCAASTTEALVDAVASGRHQAVLFALCPERDDDLVTLRVLRRLAPDFPLVVVADHASLEVRRLIQPLRPVYFAPRPVDPKELCEAVRDACGWPPREASAG
jgi:DNA-binding NtrC family response regulator